MVANTRWLAEKEDEKKLRGKDESESAANLTWS